MTLSWLANANLCTTNAEVQEQLTANTCPTDGYVHAWIDPNNPLLVWSVPTCPADSVEPLMQAVISNMVNVRYNNTNTIADPHLRTEQILANVKSDVNAWLYLNTTLDIANYLSNDAKMQTSILSAMATEGAINLINVTS
jgi:hypothetical protein